jgi:hypothetical protein
VPIRTKIAVEASPEKFKDSLALLQKYRAALKGQYGPDALRAPYIQAASAAGNDLSKFIDNLDKAAGSETRFSAAAQKAGSAFHGLASGVKQTLENLARYALSPLQILFPTGLAVGLAGLGAGLAGVGIGAGLYGLDSAAANISDRRRRSMGLGVSYGSLSAYDLDFSRFGVGEGTLGAVAGGIYDFTSPQYLGLRSAGATGHGDTSEAAVDLIRSIPELLQGVPDQMVGPVARSHNLTSLLDMQSIIRLKNHPEEIEKQVERYREDRKTFDISKDAQERWASFDAAISRAGRDIETVLGRNLVALTPGLIKFSDDVKNFIDALIDSGSVTNALKGIQSGLQWLESGIGSATFKRDAKEFLGGLQTLGPYIDRFVNGPLAKGLLLAGRGLYYGADLFGNPNYNPSLGGLAGDVLGVRGQDAPHRTSTGLGGSSIRYYAGRAKERPPYGRVIDSSTGKMLPEPRTITLTSPQSMSDIPDLSAESTYPRKGEPLQDVSGFIWHHTGSRGTPEDIIRTLNQRGLGVQYIMDRDGKIYHALPEGTRGAHILPSEINNLSNSNTEGMEVIANDDADVTMAEVIAAKRFAQDFSKLHPGVQYFGHGEVNPHHKQATEGLTIADAVRNGLAPTTTPSSPVDIPLTQRTLLNFAGGSVDTDTKGRPGAPMALPGAKPAQEVGDILGHDNAIGLRNPALRQRGRALHILDHIDRGPPPGPIIVHDMTGGSINISVSRHEAMQ